MKERITALGELPAFASYFWDFPRKLLLQPQTVEWKSKIYNSHHAGALQARLRAIDPFDKENIRQGLRELATELGQSAGNIMQLARFCVTATRVGGPVPATMEALGKQETCQRIEKVIQTWQ
ncbi:uncharacterized protein LOC135121555 [Zophobas morio]|uniref:uncharacterized protein LOC135121555 n=1 Tax=Zophobas morio TaxID=2755281 RepID=UPI003082A5B2